MSAILSWKGPDFITTAFGYNGAPTHFIHFDICPGLDPQSLQVLVQDTSYDGYKTLGPVRRDILLPRVVFAPYSKLIVQGTTPSGRNISFTGKLTAGATYVLHTTQPGNHSLDAHISMNNGCSCCAYSTPY